jgi:hypothetical protein
MDDDFRLLDQHIHQRGVAYVAVSEAPQRMPALQHVLGKIFDRAGVCENVENDDPVLGIFFTEVVDQVGAYESGAARDQNRTHQESR